MTWLLAGAVAAALTTRPPKADQALTAVMYDSVVEAIDAALVSQPRVVAFGEYHQTNATAAIPSALSRFTSLVLPTLAPRLSHLVVETWVTTGRCGEAERAVTEDVQKTTERPAATATEIEVVLRSAAARGVRPRILSVSCADYQAMRPAGQTVDYDRTLRVTEHALEVAALAALREFPEPPADSTAASAGARPAPAGAASPPSSPVRPLVALYGGALHNDVYADRDLAPYTFAPRLQGATLGRYVEIDLVVAAYVEHNPAFRSQDWWRAYLRLSRAGHRPRSAAVGPRTRVAVVRRGPTSFVIIFPA